MSGENILVIDDSKEIARHLTQQLLPTLGYKTLQAFDGRTGLDIIRQERPDLIMLDLNLPEMTGIDVLQVMAKEQIGAPVILMTGYGSEKNAIDAFRLGIKDYLVKPFTVDEVVTAINRALSTRPAAKEPGVEKRNGSVDDGASRQHELANEGMRRQLSQMKTLFGIGKVVTSLLNVEQILERVLDAAVYLTNAEESIVWLPESKSGVLRAYAQKGGNGKDKQILSLSMRDSQVGQVMRSGRPLRLYTGTGQGFKVKTGYLARAIMYVPLMVRGRSLGVLSVTNRLSPRAFSERDEFLLVALADYAAIALQNARIFQATDAALTSGAEDLRTLSDMTRSLTETHDLNEIVHRTIEQVHGSWNVEASSVWLLDPETNTLRVLDNVGTPSEPLHQLYVPLGQGIVGYVAQSGKAVSTNDVANHPLHYRSIDEATGFRTRTLLCVPLIYRGSVIGALQLLNKDGEDFDEKDMERAQSLAAAVAIAVHNALHFNQMRQALTSVRGLSEQLRNAGALNDAQQALLEQIASESGHISDLVAKAVGETTSPD